MLDFFSKVAFQREEECYWNISMAFVLFVSSGKRGVGFLYQWGKEIFRKGWEISCFLM